MSEDNDTPRPRAYRFARGSNSESTVMVSFVFMLYYLGSEKTKGVYK